MTNSPDDPLESWRAHGLGDPTWFSTEPLGHHISLGLVSSGPVAVLAGFVLAAAVTLATTSNPEDLDKVAILTLALSSASLFLTLTRVVAANAVYSKPSDRLEWFPEARVSKAVLLEQRKRQRGDFARFYYLRRSALRWYPTGAALALLGLALVLLAQVDGSRVDVAISADTISDAAAFAGFFFLVAAAAYLLSFMPPLRPSRNAIIGKLNRLLTRVDESRDVKALLGGIELLHWEIDPALMTTGYQNIVANLVVEENEPGNAALLDRYTPPPRTE